MYILWETLGYDGLGRFWKYESDVLRFLMATSEEHQEQTQDVCLVSNYGYLNSTLVTETQSWMQRHSSPLSRFLSLPKGSTENVAITLGSNTPECSPVWRGLTGRLLERYFSRLSVLFPYHCCSQHSGPMLMARDTPLRPPGSQEPL